MTACDVPGAMPAAGLRWRHDATVELVEGYTVVDQAGHAASTVYDVSVAIEGGFAHIDVPGRPSVQIVSAPGVRRISYPRS